MKYITIKDLSIGYDAHPVLENINLEIDSGDYICVIGENGAGKSTFLKTILNLIKPLKGSFEYAEGVNQSDFSYLPQQNDIQKDFPATVAEIVISGFNGKMKLRPFYNKQEKETAKALMEKVGIYDLRNKSFRDLSGGQKQRTLLARALCADGKIIVLDEPNSGLDPVASEDLYNSIGALNAEGISIVMVTHDLNGALKYANKILHLGKEAYFASKEEYIESETGKQFISRGGAHNA